MHSNLKVTMVCGAAVALGSAALYAQPSTTLKRSVTLAQPALGTPAQREARHPPLIGFGIHVTGVDGQSVNGDGVFGATSSAKGTGGWFQNFGSGDHLQAGAIHENIGPLFRVANNGDVLVRGRVIGAKGDKGDQGDQGEQGVRGPEGIRGPQGFVGGQGPAGQSGERGPAGPPGPVGGKSVAVCGVMAACGCIAGLLVTGSHAPCSVTADTGACQGDGAQVFCCVCKL
jgi:hypothetical protein